VIQGGGQLRTLQENDFLPVQQTLSDWWDDWGDPQAAPQRRLLLPRLFFQHFTDTSTVVLDDAGEILAYLIGFGSHSRPEEAYIHFVGVRPQEQGKGIGRHLYERFFAECRRRHITRVSCLTSPGNTSSVAFHRAMGFEVLAGRPGPHGADVQPDYDGPGLDRVCFLALLNRWAPEHADRGGRERERT
jgi:ribosomal protein S18 acetylase RimI-like enzyme